MLLAIRDIQGIPDKLAHKVQQVIRATRVTQVKLAQHQLLRVQLGRQVKRVLLVKLVLKEQRATQATQVTQVHNLVVTAENFT